MNLDDIIIQLRRISLTQRQNVEYKGITETKSLLDEVKKDCRDKHGFSDSDIESIVVFSLDLLDIKAELTGARRSEPCTRQMLLDTFDEVPKDRRLPDDEKIEVLSIRDAFMAVIDAWYRVIGASGLDNLDAWPVIDESLPLSYHLTAFKESKISYSKSKKDLEKKKDEFPPRLYVAFGFYFHKKLRTRMIQFNDPSSLTVKGMEELARDPFQYASDSVRNKTDLVKGDYDKKYQDDWLENYKKAGRSRGHTEAQVTAENKRQAFERFCSERVGKPRDFYVRRMMSGGDEPDQNEQADGVELPIEPALTKGFDYRSGKQSPPWEAGIELFPGTRDDSGAKNKSASWKQDMLHSRFVPFSWELKTLQPYHYAFFYDIIHQAIGKSNEKNAITLFYLILMHTGIDPDLLLDLIADGPECTGETLDLIKEGNRYYLLIPKVVSLVGKPSPHCYPTAEKVYIPIPAEIARRVPSKPADGSHVFSYLTDKGAPSRLTKQQIAAFWLIPEVSSRVKKRKKRRYIHGIKVTPKTISYAFYALHCGLFGLDPVIACHVSGMDHRLIYGPQLHYIYVPHERLEREYLESFCSVHNYIRDLSKEYFKPSLNPGGMKKNPVLKQEPIVVKTDLPGYGSSAVAYLEFLKDSMLALDNAVTKEKDLFRRHNLYISYTYLAVQFATMLRPHDDPRIYWHHFNQSTGTITIADKDSRDYSEQRTLPLPQRVKTLLIRLKEGRDILDKKRREYCSSRQASRAERIFNSVRENGVLAPFTFDTILDSFKSLAMDFNVPDNVGRHVTRTRLYQDKVSHSMAAAWAGHARIGREVAGIASTTTLAELARACLPSIEALLDDLGVRELEYLP